MIELFFEGSFLYFDFIIITTHKEQPLERYSILKMMFEQDLYPHISYFGFQAELAEREKISELLF